MCGIVGLVAKTKRGFTFKHRLMFESMLFADTLRGKDATGVYLVNKFGNVDWMKESKPAIDTLRDKEFDTFLNKTVWDTVIMVGHNRSATVGNKSDENAHPFVEGNTILVHNGTIKNKLELNKDVEVDSHAIAHAIEEHGIIEALPMINGAFALACYNAENKSFNLVRNDERPLFIAESDDFWAFASEPWMIHGMAWRNSFKLQKLREVPVSTLLRFNIRDSHDLEFLEEEISFEKKVVKEKKPKKEKSLFPVAVGSSTKQKEVARILSFSEHSNWKKGDLICFKPEELQVMNGNKFKITGKAFLDDEVDVICFADNGYTLENCKALLAREILVADVNNTVKANKMERIYCSGPSPSQPITSINDIEVNEEMLCMITHCSETGCKNEIDDSMIEESFIRYKANSKKISCVCPECVQLNLQRNSKWGKINENRQTACL